MGCPQRGRYNNASPKSNAIALTFDDGPGPFTEQVLDILKANNVQATFCIVGERADGYHNLLRRMVDEGHEIVNHSWTHPHMTTLTGAQINQELRQTSRLINFFVGRNPCIFRPPFGEMNPLVAYCAAVMNMSIMKWNLVASLYPYPLETSQDILDKAAQATKGDIVLFHDGGYDPDGNPFDRTDLVEALPDAISIFKGKNLGMLTASTILRLYPPVRTKGLDTKDPCLLEPT